MARTITLVQLLLPLSDNDGQPYPDDLLEGIKQELSRRFGGMTAYERAPAKGLWRHDGKQSRDNIVVVEVMVEDFDREWWSGLRGSLEAKLGQKALVFRAIPSVLL